MSPHIQPPKRRTLLTVPVLRGYIQPPSGAPPGRASTIDTAQTESRMAACFSGVLAFIVISLVLGMFAPARAQDAILSPGDAVVTGFSGIAPPAGPVPPGKSPLDGFLIDLEGPSAQIISFAAMGGQPNGQLAAAPVLKQFKAGQLGQVFAIAFDDGFGQKTPNSYFGATSAFGLHIVAPDNDGDGRPERLKKGEANAEWMPGQFGPSGEGPGAIWKVDGLNGEVSLFTTLPNNSGPGVGDIVFDKEHKQFFASDLDAGLIYRIGQSGEVLDSFDHGVAGRPAKGQAELADNGERAEINDAAFDVEDPSSWGYTQDDRMVWGVAIRDGRIYYAVAGDHQVWSIGIAEDGNFAGDPRWEFDAEGLSGDGPITDMLFDAEGRIYLAQRGKPRGSYDYSLFAEPEKSAVTRYRREDPDDPSTDSIWVEEPEDYAIGMPPEHRHAEGGIALGLAHDETGALRYGACGQTLWSTGHRLRPSTAIAGEDGLIPVGGAEPDPDVHGLQGNDVSLVRPQNVPPQQSYFVDYDGYFGDAAKAGHMGDVEIWQPCEGAPDFAGIPTFGELPPGILPPGDLPPGDLPPEFPPDYEFETNLKLTKWASPKECSPWNGGWLCQYRIRIKNTGPDFYSGPVVVEDFLPANPAGASMGFSPTPPWNCWNTGPTAYKCFRPGVFLAPSASIGLKAYVWVPKSYPKCHVRNVAAIEWAPGGTQWNTDPTDDDDDANALIPAEHCKPGKKTDLKIYKRALLPCYKAGDHLRCAYRVTVENQGPGPYNGDIVVEDIIPATTTAAFSSPAGTWDNCPKVGGTHTCTFSNASLPVPGASTSFTVRLDFSYADAKQMNCKVRNRVKITQAPGGSPKNTDPTNDTASAVANVPDELCTDEPEKTDLKIYKRAYSCYRVDDHLRCAYRVTVRNMGPGAYNGDIKVDDVIPPGTTGIFSDGIGNWDNCPNVGNTHTCTLANASLPNVGDIATFNVRVDFTREQAREMHCRIRNHVKITEAPGGSPKNTNAANDTADAVGNVPAELCLKPRRSNLKIEKIASPTFCNKADGGWWCHYAIRVINTGPSFYLGPIEVEEALPAEPLDANWNAPWNCAGIGGAGAICKRGLTLIPVNHSRTLFLNVKFSDEVVKAKNCVLPNVAKIKKAPGGTNKNTDPSDDIAGDSAKVDPQFCAKEPTNLSLDKYSAQPQCNSTGGGKYRCPYNVIVKNTGPGVYKGEITVKDWLPQAASAATFEVLPPWNCTGAAPALTCKHPYVELNPAQQVLLQIRPFIDPAKYGECSLKNTARILKAAGGTLQNQDASDDEDSATMVFPPAIINGKPYCYTAEPIVSECPAGFDWNGRNCDRIGTYTPPPPPPPGRVCPAGFTGRYPDCDRIVNPDPECPEGTVGKYPNCRRIADPTPECPRGTVGKYPNCREIVEEEPEPECRGGQLLRRGRCVCPASREWNGRQCVPKTCPRGMKGRPPHCYKAPVCTGGRVLEGRQCVCTGRRVWNGRRCVVRKCPSGTRGRWPNCERIVRPCPRGTVGEYPNCEKVFRPDRKIFRLDRNRGREGNILRNFKRQGSRPSQVR